MCSWSVARISSAVFVHANGLGSAFQVAIHSRTSFSSATTLLWTPRLGGRSTSYFDLKKSGRGGP